MMKKIFELHTAELHELTSNLEAFHEQVLAVARHLKESYVKGGKVLIAGNGGSAAEAQHFSDEMVGRYKADRRPYPAVALSADGMVLTCIGNDYGFDEVFKRQVEALGNQGDVFIGLTTSGVSKNILLAAVAAREQGLTVIAFTGQKGPLTALADLAIESPSGTGARIQELHLHAIHLICEAFEPDNEADEASA